MPSYCTEVSAEFETSDLTAALRSCRTPEVTITDCSSAAVETAWAVPFGSGQLQWRQREVWRVRRDAVNAEFEQAEGPFSRFMAALRVVQAGSICVVRYQVEFTTSIPNWAGAVDRAVGGAILRAAVSVVDNVATARPTAISWPNRLHDADLAAVPQTASVRYIAPPKYEDRA